MDLTGDGKADIGLHLKSSVGRELVVLVRGPGVVTAYLLPGGSEHTRMTCLRGETIRASEAGRGQPGKKEYRTPGAYIVLRESEGGAVAFVWNGSGFSEIWVAD